LGDLNKYMETLLNFFRNKSCQFLYIWLCNLHKIWNYWSGHS